MNSITFFLFFIPILALILLGLNLIFAPHNPYQEKSSTFECGFHSFLGQNRTQFNISFFIFGLLFLTFDLELVMALPGLISIYTISGYGISIMLLFFVILTVGFAFELGKKALSIDSKQYSQTIKSSFQFVDIYKNIVLTINISVKEYFNKFNMLKLCKGFIMLRFMTFFIACTLVLINIINAQDIVHTSSQLILLFIVYALINTPWSNNKIPNLLIALIINSIILFIILYLIKFMFNVTGLDLYALMLFAPFFDISDPSISYFDRMPQGDGPQGSGPNNGGPGYPNPNNGGPGGPDPNDFRGPSKLHTGTLKVEGKTNLTYKETEDCKEFIHKWYLQMSAKPMKERVMDCIEKKTPLRSNTATALVKQFNVGFKKMWPIVEDSEFNKLKEAANNNFDFYKKKNLTPEEIAEHTKTFKLLLDRIDTWSSKTVEINTDLFHKVRLSKQYPIKKSDLHSIIDE